MFSLSHNWNTLQNPDPKVSINLTRYKIIAIKVFLICEAIVPEAKSFGSLPSTSSPGL
jgi:hypothetical protein